MLIPHQGGAAILLGIGGPRGPLAPSIPSAAAHRVGQREGGRPGMPPPPDPACPAWVPTRHVPTCCRSRPKITTAPPKGVATNQGGGEGVRSARELLCIAAGCAQRGIFIIFFFFSPQRESEPGDTPSGSGALGAEGRMLVAPGRMRYPGCSPADGDVNPSRAAPTLAFAAPVGRMRGSSRGSGGAGEGAGTCSPTLRAPPRASPYRLPSYGPSPGRGGG